jgi:UDP-N-acetylmuramate--alanine ligase
LPQAIVDAVRDGDVVLCMGAGSIGAVPAKVAGLQQNLAFVAPERPTV